MVRIRSKIKACVLACALLGAPAVSVAAGMGKMNVLSGLGQPLLAEIDLVSVQEDELSGMAAKLASPEMFREAQLQYPSHLTGLKFSVEKRPNGTRYIKVTSSSPVSEPFIDVLIELNWQTGRLVREFTALLDPLGDQSPRIDQSKVPQTQVVTSDTLAKQQAAAAGTPATGKPGRTYTRKGPRVDEPGMPDSFKSARADSKAAEEKAAADAKAAAETKAAQPATEPTRPEPVVVPRKARAPKPVEQENTVDSGEDGYKVKPGETLAQIAGKTKPDGISLEQMLVGLYQSNEDAFLNGNMNRLRAGKILSIPAKEKVEAISPEQAVREIKTHSNDWNSYRQKLAETVAKAPAEASAQSGSGASGKLAAKVDDKTAPLPGASKEVLKLSGGDAKGKAAAVGKGEQEKNAALEEQIAREKALKDANERVAKLQQNIAEMQKLLEMKNKAGADLQTQSAKPAEPPKEKPAAENPAPFQQGEPAVAPAADAEAPVQPAPSDTQPPAQPKPEPVKPAAKAPEPTPEPGLLDSLMDNSLLIGGGLLGLGLLGGAAFFLAKRRKKPSFEDSIITGGDLRANTVLGNTGGAIINTNATESSFLTDFSRAGLGNIDTDEVDPIAEAEVYMAYGRDAQAEEILKDALAKDGSRQEIRLKLLEIYAGRKNLASFEEVASELFSATGGKGQLWANAAQMGRDLDPANPLYKTAEASGDAQFVKTQVIDRTAEVAKSPEPVAVVEDVADLDFDLGEPEPLNPVAEAKVVAEPAPAEPEDVHSLDFDLGDFSLPEASAPVVEPATVATEVDIPLVEAEEVSIEAVASAAADSKQMLDFDFQLDAMAESGKADTMPELEHIDLSLELPAVEEPGATNPQAVADLGLDDADPMATKIDLAKAYLDMGDKEGAREILLEVVQDGAPSYQSLAKQLLEQL